MDDEKPEGAGARSRPGEPRPAEGSGPASFIVRVAVDPAGDMTGIVQRARTGEKAPFRGVEAVGPLILRMLDVPASPPENEEGA